MKNITILCLGTRGDIQPYAALALGLQERGFRPKLAAPINFEAFIRGYGLEYSPIEMNTEEGLKSKEGRAWLAAGNSRAFIRHLNELMKRDRPALERGVEEAARGADAIVGTAMTLAEGISISEKLKIPFLASQIYPLVPASREYPNFLVAPKGSRLGLVNYVTHLLFERAWWQGIRGDLNQWRSKLGLPAMEVSPARWCRERRIPTLHHYSETLFPRPADWPGHHVLTGPLFVPERREAPLSGKLLEFLHAGPPPVFLGFGSMPILDPEAALQMTSRVTHKLGVRAVIGAGWSEFRPAAVDRHVFLVDSAEHNQLFPRCQALVHHGGAGTTFTGLRWGRPAAVFSVFADQPFWGERLRKAGAGIHYGFRAFSEETLLASLRHVLSPEVQARARELGKRLEDEAGVAASVEQIERRLGGAVLRQRAAVAR
ncbi:MAG TPA: glycosyltransferase [Bryobacteraceae bacterium]